MEKIKEQFIIVLAMSIWGASWISNKILASYAPPQVISFAKFLVVFLLLIPFFINGRKKEKFSFKYLFLTILTAIFLLSFNRVLYTGLKIGYAGIGGIIVSSISPAFTYMLVVIFGKKKILIKDITALLIGISGGAVIIDIFHFNLNTEYNMSLLFFMISAFIWSIFAILSKKSQAGSNNPFIFMFILYGVIAFIEFFGTIGSKEILYKPIDLVFAFNIIFVSGISLLLASSVFFSAAKKLPSEKANSYTMLVPVFALLFGFIILKEPIKINIIVGGIFTFASVYLFNKKEKVT